MSKGLYFQPISPTDFILSNLPFLKPDQPLCYTLPFLIKVPLPDFVLDHDALLEDQPLTDYGLTANKEMVEAGTPNPLQ